jgi:hypothetical protein
MKPLINDKTSNLYPIIGLQELRKNAVNPTNQSAVSRLRHENNVAGTGEQSLKTPPHHVTRHRIPKLAGKPRYFNAILLACLTYRIA